VEDLSDIEREEQLRNWWSENWLWIVGGIAIGLAVLAGYQYWQQTRFQAAEKDEATYLGVLDSLGSNQRDAAATQADALRSEHPKSPYADQADLALARAAVDARDFATAAKRLRTVADGSRDPQLRLVARSRLARVLSEQGDHDAALGLLDAAKAGAFTALFHEVRGDVFAAKGDNAAAAREYEAALTQAGAGTTGESAIDRAFIELKRDALPVAATAVAPEPAAPAPAATADPAATAEPTAPAVPDATGAPKP
jgi:predicted negative regulator of RcsB-dependent stress response